MSTTVYAIQPSLSNTQYIICEASEPYKNQLDLIFNTEEEAVCFASKHGLKLCNGQKTSTHQGFSTANLKNSLIEGDCLEVLKKIPDNVFDMVLCEIGRAHV